MKVTKRDDWEEEEKERSYCMDGMIELEVSLLNFCLYT